MEELQVDRWRGPGPFAPAAAFAEFAQGGLSHYEWGNAPHDHYGEHSHSYKKTLICLAGSIVFHVPGAGDLELHPGDRLVLPPGTRHAATVGPQGVRCVEAHGG